LPEPLGEKKHQDLFEEALKMNFPKRVPCVLPEGFKGQTIKIRVDPEAGTMELKSIKDNE